MFPGNDMLDIDEQEESDKSSVFEGDDQDDIDDEMSEDNGPYYDSDWSDAVLLLHQEQENNSRTT